MDLAGMPDKLKTIHTLNEKMKTLQETIRQQKERIKLLSL